ncbi:MAG TPA: uroporphyrinogen decarboxylase [Thermodesulfobacteriota bacterium]|nr:uroporphyrinogen decarboxylase [Thermodesulfobacteriota bacterium]
MTNGFNGLRVVAFESRRAKEIEKLISYHGGVPLVAPSMREVPISESTEAFEFAEQLFDGKFDVIILLTGVGTRALADTIATEYPRERLIESLRNVTLVARGPKPVAALRKMGLKADILVPEPNTWRDILTTIDSTLPLQGRRVAVQEYGISNSDLLAGLSERGAIVTAVPVYRWALPEDLTPLRDAIHSIAKGDADISLFTSSQQVHHLIQVARMERLKGAMLEGFKRVAIGSIGPTTTETLQEVRLSIDYEPDSPKMGNLVREMARRGEALLRKKRIAYSNGVDTGNWRRIDMVWTTDAARPFGKVAYDSVFMKACRREPTEYTPIWLMRQAGRFLREYRELRAKVPFLELCKTPELAAEVTLSAVDRLAVDAAIIFADILLVVEPLGIELEFSKGEGPVIKKPIRSRKELDVLREFEPEALQFVYDAVRMTRRALDPNLALIGFAGAPFTVASYVIEGGGSRNYENTKGLMYTDAGVWNALMERLSRATAEYLNRQIAAGADAIQLFDSWVGCLSPDDYREFVLPHMKRLIGNLTPGVPVIHFGTGTAALLELMKEAGGDVIGFDWRVDLGEAWARLGYNVAVQGNLDPVVLFAPPAEIRRRAISILEKADGHPGHIFNLGHGVPPGTPVDHVFALVDTVHEYSSSLGNKS